MKKFKKVVSSTTRKKRNNEIDGVDYHFIDLETFNSKNIISKAFYDGAVPKHYGIDLDEIVNDAINVTIVETAGANEIKQRFEGTGCKVYCVLLEVPKEVRKERYFARNAIDSNEIEFEDRDKKDNSDFNVDFKYDIICNTTNKIEENEDIVQLYKKVLELSHGDIVCIMGKAGTGKTTVTDYLINDNVIDVVNLHFIDNCNYKCHHCFAHKENKELSFEDICLTVDKIKIYYNSKGITGRINLVGGEIFLSKNLQNIIDYINRKGIDVSIVTNGSLLTKEFINLNKDKIKTIGISVDSLKDNTNISLGRHCKKNVLNEEQLIDLCKCINENGISLKINKCLLKTNLEDDISSLLNKVKVDRLKIFQMKIVGSFNESAIKNKITDKEFTDAVEKYKKYNPVIESAISMESSYLIVNSVGQVYCNFNCGMLGNVYEDDFRVLFNNPKIDMSNYKKRYL
ncbi:MAG: viperin family antiviral radical SAM protein [bacterium]